MCRRSRRLLFQLQQLFLRFPALYLLRRHIDVRRNVFRLFLGYQGRNDTVVYGPIHGLFVGKFYFRLGRMDVDVYRRRVHVNVNHGEGIARFGQHGVIGVFHGLKYEGIVNDAAVDDAGLPGPRAL